MSKFEIYLARTRPFQFSDWTLDHWEDRSEEDFDKVALIEVRNEWAAFKNCQHLQGPWDEQDHVLEVYGDKIRSLSVGDVLLQLDREGNPKKALAIRHHGAFEEVPMGAVDPV